MTFNGTVLSVGGGFEQVPAIQAAQRLGYRVVAVDRDPGGPGMRMAAKAEQVDIADATAVIEVASANAVDAVVPGPIGRWLTTVGAVNDALELRGVTAAAAAACADKRLLAQTLRAAGIEPAEQLEAEDAAGLTEAARALIASGGACVLKPARGAGSRAVAVVESLRELDRAVEWHLANRPAGDTSVAERFVEGEEVGVDAAVVDGQVLIVLVRAREQTPMPHRFQIADTAPAPLSAGAVEAVRAELQRAAGALGLVDCLMHADVVVDDRDQASAHVIEVSARPAGAHVADALVPAATGVRILEEGLRLLLGQKAWFAPSAPAGAARRFLPIPAGRVLRAGPPPAAVSSPDVLVFRYPLAAGQHLETLSCMTDALARGMVITRGEDAASARRLADEVVAGLDVEVEPLEQPARERTAEPSVVQQ